MKKILFALIVFIGFSAMAMAQAQPKQDKKPVEKAKTTQTVKKPAAEVKKPAADAKKPVAKKPAAKKPAAPVKK